MPDDLADQVAGLGALVEPARRALYLYVAAQPDAVSREQAASAVGIALHSAKFHLDKLVEQGLLDVEYRRLSGLSGPGAGRPSKLYRRSSAQFAVSLPERRYDLAGHVLASAIDRAIRESVPVDEAVRETAHQEGQRIAETSEVAASSPELERTTQVLAGQGYEPRVAEREVCLANCPFDRLVAEHTELVCTMNLALVDGVLEGLGAETLTAELAPQEGFCCVRLRR